MDKKFSAAGSKIVRSKVPGPIYDVHDNFKYKKVFFLFYERLLLGKSEVENVGI